MTSKEGGFYSAEDADSEKIEGKFYVWNPKQVVDVLGKDADRFMKAFDVTPNRYVTGIITEKGVATAPYEVSLPALAGTQ